MADLSDRSFRSVRARSVSPVFALRRAWPLRPAGASALVLGAAAFSIGRARIDLVLTLSGLFAVVAALLLGLVAALAWWRLDRDVRRALAKTTDPLEGLESRELSSGFRLPRRFVPLAGLPSWRWLAPAAHVDVIREDGTLREVVTPSERGLGEHIVREFEIGDCLGLWRLRRRIASRATLRVLPDPGSLSPAALETCLAGGDLVAHPLGRARGDRVDYRTYTRSDPARLILWKVYARSRELLVRTHEPARSPESHPLVFLVCADGDDAAAATARVLLKSQILGDGARFACDGQPEPVTDPEAYDEVIARSISHRSRGGRDLAIALSHGSIAPDDPVVLICPAAPGEGFDPVLEIVGSNPERFLVLAAADAEGTPPIEPRWSRWLLRALPAPGPTLDGLSTRLSSFVEVGARVALADRVSGAVRVLSEGRAAATGRLGASA